MAKPKLENTEVITSNKDQKHVVGVELNASVIETLSSTLYDHKIEAVIREYVANVTDSHTMAGVPERKGVIHVPTPVESYFSVEDFGTGLSEEELYDIFATLGKSNKRESNALTGALGMGSKSFLSVADSMTVETRKDGKMVVGLFYKSEDGMIYGQTQHRCNTMLDNGTKITISVNINEISQWRKNAAYVLGAFRVKHEYNSLEGWEEEYELTRKICQQVRDTGKSYWSYDKSHMRYHRDNTFVLMGDVLYAIPNPVSLIKHSNLKNRACKLLGSGFYVTQFEIGDLAHAPSRETISLRGETKRLVSHRLNKDIISNYRDLMEGTGKEVLSSVYRFYHEVWNTELGELLKEEKLPFGEGSSCHRLFQGDYSGRTAKVYGINTIYDSVSGLFPNSSTGGVNYKSLKVCNQHSLLKIKKPCAVYSENTKGLYKPTQTVENLYKQSEYDSVFYLKNEVEETLQKLNNFFGFEVPLVCADEYSPEKPKSKGGSKRAKLGIKEDYEVAARMMDLTKDKTSYEMTKVDLSEQGVYHVEQDSIVEIKGIVKGFSTKLNFKVLYQSDIELLKVCGVNKVVIKNQNNKGKIERAGTEPLEGVIQGIIKDNKKELVKQVVYKKLKYKLEDFDDQTKVLIDNNRRVQGKLKKVYSKFPDHDQKLSAILRVGSFHLDKTKMYESEYSRLDNHIRSFKDFVKELTTGLRLWDIIDYRWDEDEILHYLKLEKIVK